MDQAGWAKYWVAQVMNFWEIPGAVLLSFAVHIFLMVFANIRRRKASGVRMLLLWAAYQLANWVAPYALNNMSSCDDNMSQRQQLLAFWATFLLHNLGGPDNMSAFSLEDNALYKREALLVLSRIVGASYFLYKHLHRNSGAGALMPASIIVFAVGAAKHAERVWALWQGDLGNIRGTSKEEEEEPSRHFTPCASAGVGSGSLIRTGMDRDLDDEEALMVAHDMLPFCRRVMADSSVDEAHDYQHLGKNREIFTLKMENMFKVVEMELSLTYDILYTKAAVINTRLGYAIRFTSPLAIATATMLFGSYSKEGQSKPDVIITYILLLATFLLDMRWLLRALGSTWAHAFLHSSWLHHAVLCTGRWRWLRSVVVFLDLGRLRLTAHPASPSSYRRWSDTVGQYNLLSMCTQKISAFGTVVKTIELEDIWNEYQHSEGHKLSQDVKVLVFKRVQKILKSTYEDDKDGRYSMREITMLWGQKAVKRHPKELIGIELAFAGEFQEDILVWHIATQVFLVISATKPSNVHDGDSVTYAEAIKVLSEYLMFLGTVRQHMLPGLVLRGLYETTRVSLQDVWEHIDKAHTISSSVTAEEKLATALLHNKNKDFKWGFERMETLLLSDALTIVLQLLNYEWEMPKLLELVFNIWVDKLLYAATRSRPESHAKQLGCGGDLMTIVMIMAQHAGTFKMSEPGPDNEDCMQDHMVEDVEDGMVDDVEDGEYGPIDDLLLVDDNGRVNDMDWPFAESA